MLQLTPLSPAPARVPVSLFIGVPLYDGTCTGTFATSLFHAVMTLRNSGVPVQVRFLEKEGTITKARNALAHHFLQTQATHLLFVDNDIAFEVADLVRFIRGDKPIVAGFCPKKVLDWNRIGSAYQAGVRGPDLEKYSGSFVVDGSFDPLLPKGSLVEVKRAGTGLMLIKRGVFERLAPTIPKYVLDLDSVPTKVHEYFATLKLGEQQILTSEDYSFCHRAREAGCSVWADPWAKITHTGNHIFAGVAQP